MKVATLLSGGVDSSVALAELVARGHDVVAFYLKVWLEDELSHLGECPWEEDLAYARAVCERFGVPIEVRSLQREYWDRVVRYAIGELRAGRTPSPDIFCNQRIKFGAFFDEIDASFERVASGHYAQTRRANGSVQLVKGADPVKDQTYFLSHMRQVQLRRASFPIGSYTKAEVRDRAAELDLPNQARKDSQGICFLGNIQYREFVRHHLGEREGRIVELESGKTLGTHRGYWFHTIGQRQGLGLSHGPWFVSRKDTDDNVVYVTHADNLVEAGRDRYEVEHVHWIGPAPSKRELDVRIRHSRDLIGATVDIAPSGDRATVLLESTDAGIAPGQFTVFYDGDVCLGGARIV